MPTVNFVPGHWASRSLPYSAADEASLQADTAGLLNGMSLTTTDTPMVEDALANNRWLLSAGVHGGVALTKPGPSAIQGVSLESRVNGQIRCGGYTTTVISGIELNNVDKEGAALLEVAANGRVIVSNCVFAQSPTTTLPAIELNTGSKAVITNCVFTGMGTTPNTVINHSGSPANVQVAFCHNLTGNTLFTPAVAQAFNLAITTVGAVGNLHSLTIDGVGPISHTVVGGDTTSTVVDGLIAQIAATYPPDGPLAEWPVVLRDLGASMNITAKVPGTAFTLVYSRTGSAAGTLTATQANVVAGATGTGNL
jgi:hypothetical protein